ncbi:hypothetical protein STCU_06097 [Strigomonas culicis]|nr:hypothetical protein STCU_06097 [Strigomonas culicis]|eukprot:EPY26752.1 hypothetical protein STCU_06097 [Strigomonas culicis]
MVFDDFTGYFSDMEVYTLSLAFQYNLSVEALTLSGISVSDESISSLCESLVRSRVNYIDLSNTPLEDDAGRSLAALAHVSPFLRTVVVGETLISEDVLDEIDVACQFNQSNFEGNGNSIDESLFKETDLNRLKSRMQRIVRAQSANTHFCVAHLFNCCPNGDTCLYSHALTSAGQDPTSVELGQKISELFSTGGDWEQKLPPRAAEGASWKGPDDGNTRGPKLNLKRRKQLKQEAERDEPVLPMKDSRPRLGLAAPFVAVGFLLTVLVAFRKYRC